MVSVHDGFIPLFGFVYKLMGSGYAAGGLSVSFFRMKNRGIHPWKQINT